MTTQKAPTCQELVELLRYAKQAIIRACMDEERVLKAKGFCVEPARIHYEPAIKPLDDMIRRLEQ